VILPPRHFTFSKRTHRRAPFATRLLALLGGETGRHTCRLEPYHRAARRFFHCTLPLSISPHSIARNPVERTKDYGDSYKTDLTILKPE